VDQASQQSRWQDELWAHYEQWRVLTEAEGAAIAAGEHDTLERLQQTKRQLQATITEISRKLRETGGRTPGTASVEWDLQPMIRKLLDLESANIQMLAARKRELLQKREEVERITQKLHQLRRVYVNYRPPAWEAYS